jgi:type VI secretion system protein ImpE
MTPKQLFEAGRVRDAERELTAYLRDHPTDVRQRTFLFELLCFSGDYARAEKQLSVLSEGGVQAELGAVLYYSALHAEKTRHELFEKQALPSERLNSSPGGMLNGRPFRVLSDSDPDLGPRLEVFAAGAYLWIPFEHIASIDMEAPQKLRDTLWRPATVCTGPSFRGTELGEVLVPAIYPFSWKHSDEAVWLGRVTDWAADEKGTQYPSGQRIWMVDDEEIPFLEVNSVKFAAVQQPDSAAVN